VRRKRRCSRIGDCGPEHKDRFGGLTPVFYFLALEVAVIIILILTLQGCPALGGAAEAIGCADGAGGNPRTVTKLLLVPHPSGIGMVRQVHHPDACLIEDGLPPSGRESNDGGRR